MTVKRSSYAGIKSEHYFTNKMLTLFGDAKGLTMQLLEEMAANSVQNSSRPCGGWK